MKIIHFIYNKLKIVKIVLNRIIQRFYSLILILTLYTTATLPKKCVEIEYEGIEPNIGSARAQTKINRTGNDPIIMGT